MFAERLKKSILQAAIQGRLTEQLPTDGDARDLLKKIRAEKAKLIAAKKIKAEKPLPPITDEEIPFDLPDNWVWVRLGDVCQVKGGKRIPVGHKLTKINTGHKYIRVADMNNGTILDNDIHFVPDDVYPKIKNYTITSDDVYITCAGTIGRVGTVPEKFSGANLTENADRLVFILLNKVWLQYFLSSKFVQEQISDCTKKVGQPKLAIKRIKNFIIPLPPLSEQKRIVERVDALSSEVDELAHDERELTELEENFPRRMKNSLLQAAIQGKLTEQLTSDGDARDLLQKIRAEKADLIAEKKIKAEKPLPPITDEEIPFDLPDNWVWCRLGDVCDTNIGLTYSPQNISNDGTIVLRSGNIVNGKMNYKDTIKVNLPVPENKLAKTGDILICARNGSKKLVGKSAVIDKDEMSFGAFMAVVRSEINPYIFIAISSPHFRHSLLEDVGTTTINQITQNMLKNFLIPLPPFAEQQRIVERLEELLPLCESLSEKTMETSYTNISDELIGEI